MHALLEKLESDLAAHHLTGQRVLVAVSGGADSVALLRSLWDLRDTFRLDLRAAHLNHQLRGDASRADADWVRRTCQELPLPVTIGTADVAALARETGSGLEETARTARYQFLEQTAIASGCSQIAVAHTADDQAETILHHVLRGTGLAGLRGMLRTRELDSGTQLIRPLLEVTRDEVCAYLVALGQDFREDASNLDEAYTRNRIRRRLLPLLAAEYNPNIRDALRRLGQHAAEAQSAMEALAIELLDEAVERRDPSECTLHWKVLLGHPRHVVREAFTLLWRRQNWPRQKMDYAHWDRLVEIAWHGGAATLPGNIDARRTGLLVTLVENANRSG